MSLLTLCQSLAKNVGMEVPDQIIASSDRSRAEMVEQSIAVGEELARRVDWGALQGSVTLTGDNTNKVHDLPAGFSRISNGVGTTASGNPIRSLTRAEWASLTPTDGVPRYFLLTGDQMTLWPYLANGSTVSVSYQSKYWCSNGTAAWAADTDTSLISEDLFLKGMIVRWRRQKGMEYADYEAEYEAALRQFAEFDDRSRL